MTDLLVGVGLVLVIEGLLWALAPHLARQMLETASVNSRTGPASGRYPGHRDRCIHRLAGAGLKSAVVAPRPPAGEQDSDQQSNQ